MKTIEQYIETEMTDTITRKRNSILPNLLILAIGLGLLVLIRTLTLGDIAITTCLTFGIILTAIGIALTAMNLSGAQTHFEYLPTHSRMREKKVYIDNNDLKDIVDAIATRNPQLLATLRPVVSSNSAVRILFSLDRKCILLQALREQSGHLEPESPVLRLPETDSSPIQPLLK